MHNKKDKRSTPREHYNNTHQRVGSGGSGSGSAYAPMQCGVSSVHGRNAFGAARAVS